MVRQGNGTKHGFVMLVLLLSACGSVGTLEAHVKGTPVVAANLDSATSWDTAPQVLVDRRGDSYRLVDLVDLDQPGERVSLADYERSIAEGPVRGPDGKLYGNLPANSSDQVLVPDFVGVLDPGGASRAVVGFIRREEMSVPMSPGDKVIFGFGGIPLGYVRERRTETSPGYFEVTQWFEATRSDE